MLINLSLIIVYQDVKLKGEKMKNGDNTKVKKMVSLLRTSIKSGEGKTILQRTKVIRIIKLKDNKKGALCLDRFGHVIHSMPFTGFYAPQLIRNVPKKITVIEDLFPIDEESFNQYIKEGK